MSGLAFSFFLVAILICQIATSRQEGYYWKDYAGSIPSDAVVGGTDENGENIYIGQVFLKNWGLYVVQIYPNEKFVYALMDKVYKLQDGIKILCGPQKNFSWLPVNSSHLSVQLIDKHAVVGGFDDPRGILNIGRVSYQNGIRIGKIDSFELTDAKMYFVYKEASKATRRYEILIYKNSDSDDETHEKNVTCQ